ncbi:MAG: ABC transporter ATP-binding protein [Maricaulaceae bacterium]|nr:ABC transporter ATP-binding protein [Maricaulaceae bacterium]
MPHIRLSDVSFRYPVYSATVAAGEGAGAGAAITAVKGRRYVQALHDVSFELRQGDRLALIGRNGSGKSTLLRILAGIYDPAEGEAEVEGRIGALLDIGAGMRVEATGERNIYLRGLIDGLGPKAAQARIPEIAAFADLGDYIRLPVRSYSDGMIMRLNFALATASQPEVLLLDEWIGAGDKAFALKAHARMQSLVDQAGVMVLASHNPDFVRLTCNKALWLDRGHMRAFGPVGAILDAYLAA